MAVAAPLPGLLLWVVPRLLRVAKLLNKKGDVLLDQAGRVCRAKEFPRGVWLLVHALGRGSRSPDPRPLGTLETCPSGRVVGDNKSRPQPRWRPGLFVPENTLSKFNPCNRPGPPNTNLANQRLAPVAFKLSLNY